MVSVDVKHHVYLLRNQIWQSLKEAAGKRCSECACGRVLASEGDVQQSVDQCWAVAARLRTLLFVMQSDHLMPRIRLRLRISVKSVQPPFLGSRV